MRSFFRSPWLRHGSCSAQTAATTELLPFRPELSICARKCLFFEKPAENLAQLLAGPGVKTARPAWPAAWGGHRTTRQSSATENAAGFEPAAASTIGPENAFSPA